MPETETVRKAKAGDREAFGSIVAEHGPRLAQLASWYLDGRDVDDVLQKVWASVYRKLWQLEDDSRLLPWLKTITFHSRSCRGELDRLPGTYGPLLRLRYLRDLSYGEISDAVGISVNSVKQRLHQGRQILRSRLARNRGMRSSPACSSRSIGMKPRRTRSGRRRLSWPATLAGRCRSQKKSGRPGLRNRAGPLDIERVPCGQLRPGLGMSKARLISSMKPAKSRFRPAAASGSCLSSSVVLPASSTKP